MLRLMTSAFCTTLAFALLGASAPHHDYEVLGSFGQSSTDGYEPYSGLVVGPGGDLYGTTANGGSVVKRGPCELGCGTVYRVSRSGRRTTIHNFAGPDGELPVGALLAASDGRLYGTTTEGGDHGGGGTVFSLKPDGSGLRILHYFDGQGGAANPQGGLIELRDGFVYGTTVGGPPVMQRFPAFAFRIRRDGSGFAVLHRFYITRVSGAPTGALLFASDGRLYGTTGISSGNVGGTIFRMNVDGSNFQVLHVFQGVSSVYESPGVIEAVPGTLYGVKIAGSVDGTIFSLALDGSNFRTLHRFGTRSGGSPMGALTLGPNSELYGTTFGGLTSAGTIFAIKLDGSGFRIVHFFGLQAGDGALPRAGLTLGADGSLFGTTQQGGLQNCPPFAGCGTTYVLSP